MDTILSQISCRILMRIIFFHWIIYSSSGVICSCLCFLFMSEVFSSVQYSFICVHGWLMGSVCVDGEWVDKEPARILGTPECLICRIKSKVWRFHFPVFWGTSSPIRTAHIFHSECPKFALFLHSSVSRPEPPVPDSYTIFPVLKTTKQYRNDLILHF